MFKKLRKKMAISNTVVFSFLVLGLFIGIFALNYANMRLQVEDTLDKVINSARTGAFMMPGAQKMEPNTIILFVDTVNREISYISNEAYYEDEELIEITTAILALEKSDGRIKVGDYYLAYNKTEDRIETKISLYDYTLQQNDIITLVIILACAFFVSVISIFFIFKRFAKKSVKPIEEAFYKQKELVANASHELKTPLTIITTSLSILNTDTSESQEEQKKWLNNISSQTQRMAGLINDMLELAKVDNQNDNKILTDINLSQILQGIILGMEAPIFENEIKLNEDINENLFVIGDKTAFEKLIYILLENAVKYTPKNGYINIKLYSDKKRVIFKIKNSGSGIPASKLPKLFDRFYRVEESHTQGTSRNFGLGLSIAKSIVDSYNGNISVSSKEGEYTEFILTFKQ